MATTKHEDEMAEMEQQVVLAEQKAKEAEQQLNKEREEKEKTEQQLSKEREGKEKKEMEDSFYFTLRMSRQHRWCCQFCRGEPGKRIEVHFNQKCNEKVAIPTTSVSAFAFKHLGFCPLPIALGLSLLTVPIVRWLLPVLVAILPSLIINYARLHTFRYRCTAAGTKRTRWRVRSG